MPYCPNCLSPVTSDVAICSECNYDLTQEEEPGSYLPSGTILLDTYVLGKVLGSGGFGITYLALDTSTDQKVAIKEYLPSDFATRAQGTLALTVFSGEATKQFQAGLKSFDDEARRLMAFNTSENIVHIIGAFEANGTAYIIMEYLEGTTLKNTLKDKGKMSFDEAMEVMTPVLKALSEVHKEGIIHRDVAPDNILIDKDGKIKLIDFGAARSSSALKTRSLTILLKPGYAPEEQYRSRGKQGPWTDIYAAAATFYRMVTGIRPEESMERLANDTLKAPSELGVILPSYAELALMKALAVHAQERYQDAPSFLEGLTNPEATRLLTQKSSDEKTVLVTEVKDAPQVKNAPNKESSRKALIVIIVVLIILASSAIGGLIYMASLDRQANNHTITQQHLVTFIITAPDYNESTDSRIPLLVSGTDANGNAVSETYFVGESSEGISLTQGVYEVSVPASPLLATGRLYRIPVAPLTFSIEDSGVSDETLEIVFEIKPPNEITIEEIDNAEEYAIESGMPSEEASTIKQLILDNRQSAIEETEALTAEEEVDEKGSDSYPILESLPYSEFNVKNGLKSAVSIEAEYHPVDDVLKLIVKISVRSDADVDFSFDNANAWLESKGLTITELDTKKPVQIEYQRAGASQEDEYIVFANMSATY